MSTFEARRTRLIDACVHDLLPGLDRQAWLIPVGDHRHPTGPHSQAGGWAVRASCRLGTALALVGQVDEAWRVIDRVLDYQDCRPESLTYGNFREYSAWDMAKDPNGVSFMTPELAYLYQRFRSDMPEELRQRLAESLRLALVGLNSHRCTWGYTNIALYNIAAKLMIGDALDDLRATQIAYWDWEEWRNHTAKFGIITEYSCGYTRTQVEALALMLACRARSEFLGEVRAVLRHLLTSAAIDYHPAVGRVTGPMSRSYPGNRRLRHSSGMEAVWYLIWGAPFPEPRGGLWLGAPLGPDDMLCDPRELPLPRTTVARTHGFTRTNYLGRDFALGSIDGRARWHGHAVPLFLAYRGSHQRCAIPVMAEPPVEAHYAAQTGGRLLGACTWLFDVNPAERTTSVSWPAKLTGLNTGRPDNLGSDPDRTTSLVLELGLADRTRLADTNGQAITTLSGALPDTGLAVETESVRVFLRFFTSGAAQPRLDLAQECDGEVVLRADGGRDGRPVSTRECMVMMGLFMQVDPIEADADLEAFARRAGAATVRVETHDAGWRASAGASSDALCVDVPADTSLFYSTEGLSVSANQWAISLEEGGPC